MLEWQHTVLYLRIAHLPLTQYKHIQQFVSIRNFYLRLNTFVLLKVADVNLEMRCSTLTTSTGLMHHINQHKLFNQPAGQPIDLEGHVPPVIESVKIYTDKEYRKYYEKFYESITETNL